MSPWTIANEHKHNKLNYVLAWWKQKVAYKQAIIYNKLNLDSFNIFSAYKCHKAWSWASRDKLRLTLFTTDAQILNVSFRRSKTRTSLPMTQTVNELLTAVLPFINLQVLVCYFGVHLQNPDENKACVWIWKSVSLQSGYNRCQLKHGKQKCIIRTSISLSSLSLPLSRSITVNNWSKLAGWALI